jgi:hypothetical protein
MHGFDQNDGEYPCFDLGDHVAQEQWTMQGHGPSSPSAFKALKPEKPLKRSLSQQLKKSISLTSEDMRAFSIKGRQQAKNFSLSGVMSSGMPSLFNPRRTASTVPVSEPASPHRSPSVLPPLPDKSQPELPSKAADDAFEISVDNVS